MPKRTKLITVREAMELTKLGRSTIYAGKLGTDKWRRVVVELPNSRRKTIRLYLADVLAWIDAHFQAGTSAQQPRVIDLRQFKAQRKAK